MIHCAHVDVVDIQQYRTIGAARDFTQEFPLGHVRGAVRQIARDVLEQDPAARADPELRLRGRRRTRALPRCRATARDRARCALDPGPAQMIGDPLGLDAARQLAHAGGDTPGRGGLCCRWTGTRRADEGKAAANALEIVERFAAGHEAILGDDLQPVDGVRLLEDGSVVRGPQTQTETVDPHGGTSDRGRTRA